MQIEVTHSNFFKLRDLVKVTEIREGCVYKTEHSKFVQLIWPYRDEDFPIKKDEQLCSLSTSIIGKSIEL